MAAAVIWRGGVAGRVLLDIVADRRTLVGRGRVAVWAGTAVVLTDDTAALVAQGVEPAGRIAHGQPTQSGQRPRNVTSTSWMAKPCCSLRARTGSSAATSSMRPHSVHTRWWWRSAVFGS